MASATVAAAVSAFGAAAKSKLSNPAVSGAPEDQLRGPLETLVRDLSEASGLPSGAVHLVGETTLAHLQTRPDYAVTVSKALVGFIEVKAPGKGADPRKFSDPHDKAQWTKLKSLPNLDYTDGNAFSADPGGRPRRARDAVGPLRCRVLPSRLPADEPVPAGRRGGPAALRVRDRAGAARGCLARPQFRPRAPKRQPAAALAIAGPSRAQGRIRLRTGLDRPAPCGDRRSNHPHHDLTGLVRERVFVETGAGAGILAARRPPAAGARAVEDPHRPVVLVRLIRVQAPTLMEFAHAPSYTRQEEIPNYIDDKAPRFGL